MTNESAKFLLSVYRSNGADARDPLFKEALEQAQRDPGLASWFREQRDFDEIISAKLRSIEPLTGLEATIRAGFLTTTVPRSPLVRWLAIAAALVLALMVLNQMRLSGPGRQDRFLAFYWYALTVLKPLPDLDLMTTNFQQTQEFIKVKGAPIAPTVPAALAGLPTAGSKTFVWEGHPVSLTCINLPDGQQLHLFVIANKAFKGEPIPTGFQRIGDWSMKISESRGVVIMWVTCCPVAEIKQFVS